MCIVRRALGMSGVCGNVSLTNELKPKELQRLVAFLFIDNTVCAGYGSKHLELIDSNEGS